MTRARYALASLVLLLSVASCKKDDFVENKVPVADAGPSKTILSDTVTLTGTGADADGKVVAYLWSQVSGPATSAIVNPGAASTAIKFGVSGNYLFQFMVTDDKGATGVDTMTVVVKLSNTLTLQPANNAGEYELVNLNGNDASGIANTSLEMDAWTANGSTYNIRGVVKFDLSSIPATATIKSANLYLYSDPTPNTGNGADANFGSANAFLVQQIAASWSIPGIGWFNLPSLVTANQILVPHTNLPDLDLNLDVTTMVGQMVNNNANYGFYLKLQNEVTYNSRIFVSSRNTTYPAKRPKLVVTYQ